MSSSGRLPGCDDDDDDVCICCPVVFGNVLIYQDDYKCPCCKLKKEMVINYGEHTRVIRNKRELSTDTSEPPDSRTQHLLGLLKELEQYNSTKKYQLFPKLASFAYENRINAASTNNTGLWITLDAKYVNNLWLCKITYQNGILEKKSISCGEDINYECMQLLPLQTIVKSEYTSELKNVINIVNLDHASEDYPTLLAKIFGYDDGNYIDMVQPNTLTIIDGTEINSTCYCCGGTVTCDTMLKCLCCRFSRYDVPDFQRILLRLQQDIINAEELLNEAVLMRNLKDISYYIEYYGISEYSNELLRTLTKLACKLKTGNLWHTDTIAIFSGYPLVNTVDWYWSLHFRTTDSLKFIKGTVSYNMSRVDNDCLKMGPNQRYYKLKGNIERALLVGFIVLRNGIVEKMFYFKENDICSIPYPIQNDSLRYRSEVHWYSSTDKCMCCGENYPSCNMISCSCCLNNNSQIFGDIYNTSAPKRMALESQYENGIANITFPQDVKGKYEIMDQLAKWACENDEQYPIFTEDVIVYKEIAYDVKYTSSHYVCDITYQQGIFDEDSAYCHELGCSYLQPIPLQTTLYSDRSLRIDTNEELNYEYFILVAHLYRNNISDYPNLLLKQFTYVECKNIFESNMFSFLSSTQDFYHFYDRCHGNPAFNELNSISGKINLEYLNGVSDYNSVSKYLKEVDLYILDNFEIRIFKYELLRLISRNACQLGPNLGLVLWSTDAVVAFAGYLYADEEYLALDFTTYQNITFTRSNITMDCLNMGPYQRLYQFENIAEDVFLVGYIVNHNGKMVELMFYFKDDDCSLPYPVTKRTLTSRSERECAALFSDEVAIQQKYLDHELDKSLETDVPIWKMKKIVREVNSLLDKRDANITEDLLLKLDKLGSKVELKEEVSTSTITDNVAIVISNPALDRPRGIRIAAEKNDTFREDSFSYITGSNYSQYLNSNVSSTVVLLPPSAIDSPSRISFVVFRDNRVFRDIAGDVVVNSRIVSVNIYNYTNFDEGEVIDIYLNPSSVKPGRRISRACGYWKFVENTTGYWATDGCTFHKATIPGHLDFCRCTHLTHFAEILIPRSSFSKTHEVVLEVLSVVGCILSIFGLTIIAVTAGVFDSWRNDFSNKIWLQLCLGIFLINVCFLVTIFAEFEENSIWCIATGITLHYAVLNSFMWMVAAAISSYKKLVLVFSSDISIPKFTVFALIAPLAIIGLLIFLYPHSYSQQFNEKTLSGAFCYPSGYGLLITVYTPILIMLLINWTLFALILNAICKSTNIRKHGSRSRDALRNAVVSSLLIFLFGLPWIAGLTAQFIISAYIFTITASLQGFVLFVFFILANRKTRNLWIRKLNLDKSATVTSTDIYTRSGRSKDSESSSHELKRLTSSDDPAIAPKTRVKVILSPSNA